VNAFSNFSVFVRTLSFLFLIVSNETFFFFFFFFFGVCWLEDKSLEKKKEAHLPLSN
jgi:hypothetical protein